MSSSQSNSRTEKSISSSIDQSWVSGGLATAILIGMAIWIRKNQAVSQTIKQSTSTTSRPFNQTSNRSSHQSVNRSGSQPTSQSSSTQSDSTSHASSQSSHDSNTESASQSSTESTQQSYQESFQKSANSSNQWFNFHEAELNRLREESEWRERARFVAMKNADWFTLRQAKKRPHYSKWRGATSESADDASQSQINEKKTYRASSDASYWHWHTHNQQNHDPYARYRAGYQSSTQSSDQSSNESVLIEAAKKELGISSDQSTASQTVKQPISPSFGQSLDPAIAQSLKGVSIDQVKKAFRARAFDTHPDLNDGNDEHFRRVAEAYNTLMSHLEKK